jgi:acyl dehydratase
MTTSSESALDWSKTREWIGKNLVTTPREGADLVERGTIRRQLEVLEFGCPLHYDEGVAKRYGYPGIVAPYHMLTIYNWGAMWTPGAPTKWPNADDVHVQTQALPQGENLTVPLPGTTAGFVTDLELTYERPLYIGEQVVQTENKLVDVNPRQTRVGDGAFLTYEATYTNQRGELLAKTRNTLYQYIPTPQAGRGGERPQGEGARQEPPPAGSTDAQPAWPDWSKQRSWEDVKEGDAVPEVRFPLTIQRMVMEAGANRDFNNIHNNREFARRTGAPDMYANNSFLQGMWERAVREYIGLGGTIRKIGPFRMRIFNIIGDAVVVSGKVTKKFQEGGKNYVELEMQSTSAKTGNVTVGPGPVLVTLPSKR